MASKPAFNPYLPGVPARLDRSQQHRRAMIAKIQIARKQLRMADDDYAQIKLDFGGKASLADCDEPALARILGRFEALGFKPLPGKAKSKSDQRAAQHPMARKARALWISLWHLGVVRDPSEKALEAFARRQLGCERLQWARQSEANRLIEALKAMGERHGWRLSGPELGARPGPITLQITLNRAIMERLRLASEIPGEWTVEEAAFRLCGIDWKARGPIPTVEDWTDLNAALGAKLRASIPPVTSDGESDQ